MKRFIVKEAQLKEYIENKKTEKIFCSILEDMYKNSKYLTENISITKANQSIIKSYDIKNLITPKVKKKLMEYGLITKENQIL